MTQKSAWVLEFTVTVSVKNHVCVMFLFLQQLGKNAALDALVHSPRVNHMSAGLCLVSFLPSTCAVHPSPTLPRGLPHPSGTTITPALGNCTHLGVSVLGAWAKWRVWSGVSIWAVLKKYIEE